ncbi:MAG: hypothetical protein GWM88_06525 [Pseudomonadales bacterium]|nr:hypothetical protein [Pseudomonadales bacterium]NIX07678.1 hypothetical protein [Pseudomonadales bacterium]
MSQAVESALARLEGEVEFDFLLGGINVHGTQPIGEYGRRHLMRIWRDVQETTGQTFGFRLPDVFVYNSTAACMAVEAVRGLTGTAPFGYLHRLQQLFFVEGRDVNDRDLLAGIASDFGCDRAAFVALLDDPAVAAHIREEFAGARRYGTNALPNVLWESGNGRELLAGGYADADMLVELVRAKRNSQSRA